MRIRLKVNNAGQEMPYQPSQSTSKLRISSTSADVKRVNKEYEISVCHKGSKGRH